MPRYVLTPTGWRSIVRRFIDIDGTGIKTPVVKRYRLMNLPADWQEIWPLAPNQPGAASVVSSYDAGLDHVRNVATWSAPVGGSAVSKYRVTYRFFTNANQPYGSPRVFTVNAPTVTHTDTNSNNGFEHINGYRVEVEVVPLSAENREGVARVSSRVLIPELPAPPAPTVYTINVQASRLAQSWTAHTGNRVTSLQVAISVAGGTTYTYTYPKGSTSSDGGDDTFPWNASTIGRAAVSASIRTVGPGGVSAWVTRTGTIPGPVRLLNSRFVGGIMYAELIGDGNGARLYEQASPSVAAAFITDYGNPNGTVSAPSSGGWARDGVTNRRFVVIPRDAGNGWTGRTQAGPWIKKLPNPLYVQPTGDDTWRDGQWRTPDVLTPTWIFQGSSTNGHNISPIFYGVNAFYNAVNAGGYEPAVTAAAVLLKRGTFGQIAAISPSFYLHTYASRPAAMPQLSAFRFDSGAMAREEQGWRAIPAAWVSQHLAGGGFQGIALAHPNGALNSGLGNVSNEYSGFYRRATGGIVGIGNFGTVRIDHNG